MAMISRRLALAVQNQLRAVASTISVIALSHTWWHSIPG